MDIEANLPSGQIREFYEASFRLTRAIRENNEAAAIAAASEMSRLYHEIHEVEDGEH